MVLQPLHSPFLTGLVIGFAGALIGALVDAINSRRTQAGFNAGGLMIVVAGLINTLMGITAIIYSLIATHSILTALILGLGVLTGFTVGFLLVAGLWILLGNKDQAA